MKSIAIFMLFPTFLFSQNSSSYFNSKIVIHIQSGKFNIEQNEKSKLKIWLMSFSTYELKEIKLFGHTDSIGSFESNCKLSEERVNEVEKEIKSIINSNTFFIKDWNGFVNPISNNDDEQGRHLNRCVEITLYYIKKEQLNTQNQYISRTFVGQKGSKIIIPDSFINGISNNRILIDVNESFDVCDMISNGMSTESEDGCLRTAGMVQYKIKILGSDLNIENLKSNPKEIEYWVPKLEGSDKMDFYIPGQTGKWTLTKNKVVIKFEGYQAYYVVKAPFSTKVNIDQYVDGCVTGVSKRFFTPTFRYSSVTLDYRNGVILKTSNFSPKQLVCINYKTDTIPLVKGYAYFKNAYYLISIPLDKVKYIKLFNIYILRKKYWKYYGPSENKFFNYYFCKNN